MASLNRGSATLAFSEITGATGSKTLLSLPAKSVLLFVNANIDTAFDWVFTLEVKTPDPVTLLTVPDTTVVGIADKEFDKNSYVQSLTAAADITAEWSGLSGLWAFGGNLNTARWGLAGAGTQTAGLCMGGNGPSDVTEEYNGAAWAVGGALNTARWALAGCGTQTAGLCMGGTGPLTDTEGYDGVAWAVGGALNTARWGLAGAGTQTAGLCMGGDSGGVSAVTEEYDGVAWVAGGDLNTARRQLAGAGTQDAGLCMGGDGGIAFSAVTEKYDGAAWAVGGNLNTARTVLAGAGTQTAGLCMGGDDGASSVVTEVYTSLLTVGLMMVRYAYITLS